MFHFEMFTSSIASGATTRAQVTSKFNNVVPTLNNGFQVPASLNYLHSVFGVGAHQVEVQIQTPKFLPFPYPNLVPNNRGTAFESPPRIWDFSRNPLPMTPSDEVDAFASQNAGAGETQYIGINFCDGPPSAIPSGQFLSAHWTAATTLTAGAMTGVIPVFDTALPAGLYSLVGVRAFSATGLFFQMLPAAAPLWRPGGIMTQAYDQLDPPNQRAAGYLGYPQTGWGEWLRFRQNVPPTINIFATSADTAEEGWFDLIYVSA
jgi:hypothetical protein